MIEPDFDVHLTSIKRRPARARDDAGMHYHYFTIEQRDNLAQLMQARIAQPGMEDALKRLHTPEFGVCQSCGEDIPFVQLQANPRRTHCARCLAGL